MATTKSMQWIVDFIHVVRQILDGTRTATPQFKPQNEFIDSPTDVSRALASAIQVDAAMKYWIAFAAAFVALVIGAQYITIFVVQPIGAVPEGRTIIVTRLNTMNFIDSADAWCARKNGGVSLLCRGAALGAVANNGKILLKLPYSATLYRISTGGAVYNR